jgi:predicted Zn-dependent peptidase
VFLLCNNLTVFVVLSIIDSIQVDDMIRVARELFVPERLNLAVVGPVEEKNIQGLLHL